MITPIVLDVQTGGLCRTPAFQHRPGTAKVRPERALIVD